MTAETFADLMTSPRHLAEYMAVAEDPQAWTWLVLWAREIPLKGRQNLRVHDLLASLFLHAEAVGVTPAAQAEAADSWDDEGAGRGARHGSSQTHRLLVRARLFVGRSPAGS